jgi:thioredoxin 1
MNKKQRLIVKLSFLGLLFSVILSGCSNVNGAEKEKNNSKNRIENPDSGNEISIHITKDDFIDKIFDFRNSASEWDYKGDLPCIVDFYADWCRPCQIASPILEELAKEYKGQIYVYKIDTDKEKELSTAFGIRSIPTFMLIRPGKSPQVMSGIGQTEEATREMFKQAIDEVLLNTKSKSK